MSKARKGGRAWGCCTGESVREEVKESELSGAGERVRASAREQRSNRETERETRPRCS